MSIQHKYTPISPETYLNSERQTDHKNEFFAGKIFAMSGASLAHNLIVVNITSALHTQFKNRPCQVYANDMRLKVSETGLYTYPDVIAVCDEPRFDDEHKDTLLNPKLIIEVLSQSTKNYDRGDKFKHYRTIQTFAEYLLVSQKECYIEHYVRQNNNQWLLSEINELQSIIQLQSIQCQLTLADIYDKVAPL